MSETTEYIIKLKDRLTAGLRRAEGSASRLDRSMNGLGSKAQKSGGGLDVLGGALKRVAGPLALAAAGMKAFQIASESIVTARNYESLANSIIFASGSAEEGAKNLDYLRERSNLLGTDLLSSTEGFKTLSGAMLGTKLEGQATRDVFDSVQVAASVMGLSAENTKGTLLAFGQIMGKGKVQAEELRGQIGERIPGAFGLAAKAMNVTQAELDKMMEQGQLMAEDFLPKFANQLKKTFGSGLEKSVNSSQAQFNRFNNTMLELKLTIGGVLMPLVNRFMGSIQKAFGMIKQNADVLRQAFAPLIDRYREYGKLVSDFFMSLTGGVSATNSLQNALYGLQLFLEYTKPMWEGVKGVLEEVFSIILLVKKAFEGLGGTFPIIVKTFGGLLMLLREGFLMISKMAKNTLSGVGNLLAGIFSGDLDQIKKGLSGLGEAFIAPIDGYKKMGSAFIEGFNGELVKNPLMLQFGEVKAKDIVGPLANKGASGGGLLDAFSGGKSSGVTGGMFSGLLKQVPTGPGGGGAAGVTGTKQASTSIDEVKSGRPTNIYININKMIESFNVTATNLESINNKAKDLVAQALLSAVNNVNNIAQ